MKKKLAVAATICAAFAAAPTQAAVVWSFDYTDVNFGFNDPILGSARQGVLESAADYLSGFLTSYTATINMSVDSNDTTPGSLAAAGTNYNAPYPGPGFGDQGDIMRKILGGDAADPAPGTADGSVTWNFTTELWELGTDFQPGEYDFFSTAVHELMHALGFASGIAQNGNDSYGTAPGTAGAWAPFDKYLTAFDGTPIIDQTTYILDSALWDDAKLSLDGSATPGCGAGTLFTGANAVAANGGQAVQIYAPNPWEPGSSGSHLDDNCYTPDPPGGTSHFMQEAQTVDGLGIRTLSALEVGMFQDIGYTNFGVQPPVGTVPEPSSMLLLLGSLGLLGLARRRKAA